MPIQTSMFIVKASDVCQTKKSERTTNYIRLTLIRESCKSDRHTTILFENKHWKIYSIIAGKLHTRNEEGIIPNFRILGRGLFFKPM